MRKEKHEYLVVLRHTMDDLPIRLFDSLEKALRFAKRVKPMPSEHMRDIFWTDCSTPVSVAICHFINGNHVTYDVVRHFREGVNHA